MHCEMSKIMNLKEIKSKFSDEEWKEFFEYLDDLRISGIVNMYAATPYIEEEFDVKMPVAREILTLWMETFDSTKSFEERLKNFREK